MEELVEHLTKETQDLKKQFLESTKEWAGAEFSRLDKFRREYPTGIHGFKEASSRYYRLPSIIFKENGRELFIEKSVSNAEKHYEESVIKLAGRIVKKGLDVTNIHLMSTHLHNNFETLISDGKYSVKAFTIIAGGAIQKPHYRYLIR